MKNYLNEKKKKLSAIALLGVISITAILLIFPNWWNNASLQEFKNWYPIWGPLIYFGINYLMPIYFCLCVVTLFILYFKEYIIFLKSIFARLKNICNRVIKYFSQDVLNERRFVADLFLKLLALVYLIAFGSLLWQFQLVSENGLIPYKEFAEQTFLSEGYTAILNYPSVFWLNQSNWFILTVLSLSCVISIVSLFKTKTFNYFFLWFFYLSIVTFGRDLFHFPWDTFLLEIGFLSIFLVCFTKRLNQFPRILLFTFLLLFFRQWLSMGITKILWAAPTWYDLTYMKYFWLNQPSPTPVAWYMYQLPMPFQKFFTAGTLIFEIAIPLAMFFGRKGRIVAFFISLFLSFMIQLNGNYGFFNILTVILGIWCLDDHFFKRKSNLSLSTSQVFLKHRFFRTLNFLLIYLITGFNLFYVYLQFDKQSNHPANFLNYYFFDKNVTPQSGFIKPVFFEMGKIISRFRIVSPHGVFKYIPQKRNYIQIQVKVSENDWQNLTFSKGRDIINFCFSAPIMHRLSFNFYYQSYGIDFFPFLKINPNSKYINSWMKNLINGIFDNNSEIRKLISYSQNGKVEQIRVFQNYMYIHKNAKMPFQDNSVKNQTIRILYLNPSDKFETPFFAFSLDKLIKKD